MGLENGTENGIENGTISDAQEEFLYLGIQVSFVVYTSFLRNSGLFSSDHVFFERRPSPMRRKNSSVLVVI